MRSSVSVILNNPPPDTTMSYPDYNQTAEDHQCLLILVKHIGNQLKAKAFARLYERISRLQYVRIQETQGGGARGIWVRYKQNYPVENNEWGDFQAHRKVLGLICVGKCSTQSELEEICKSHETLKEKYNSTLYDSRCLVYGYSEDSALASFRSAPQEASSSPPSFSIGDDQANGKEDLSARESVEEDSVANDCGIGGGESVCTDKDSGVFSSPPLDGDPLSGSLLDSLENGLTDRKQCSEHSVTQSVFTSHSGGHHRWRGHVRNSSLPVPPSTSLTNDDMMNIANFSLPSSPTCVRENVLSVSSSHSSSHQTLVPPYSLKSQLLFYPSVEECSNLEDDLYEFICSLFWVLEAKRLDKSQEKMDRPPLLCAPFEKKDFVGLDLDTRANKKRSQGRMRKQSGDLSLLAGLPVDAINHYNAASETFKSVSDWLWLAGCYEGLCAASVATLYPRQKRPSTLQRNSSFTAGSPPFNSKPRAGSFSSHSLPNGIDPVEYKCKNSLSPDEVIDKYREAIIHYSKYRNAGIIEMEANIKATKLLVHLEKYLTAAEFLQNIVQINLQQSDEEKIQRFTALSNLYTQIGFHRKASFFKRVAAMRCIASQDSNSNPNWSQCYYILLQTLDGYKLPLDPKSFVKGHGWPALQTHILQELVGTSRRMGNAPVSVRHMTFLLHTMFDYLTMAERREFSLQLEMLTKNCEGGPTALTLDNGFILPPVNLINLPRVKSFQLQNLAPHLRPMALTSKPVEKVQSGPFIFSPLQFGLQRDKNKNSNKMDFKWVEGDVCEVALQVFNPLSFELKVMNMGLLPDGISFETFPASLSLPAESGPYPVKLLGTPHSTGKLEIVGYTTHVFGVKSNCRLRDLPSIKKNSYVIEVVPALPQIQVVTSLPKAATFSSFADTSCIVSSVTLNLYAGARQECTITLLNCGQENVEKIDIALESRLEKDLESEFCTWSAENLSAQLPIAPGMSASFTLYIHAVGDFTTLAKAYPDEGSETASISSTQSKSKSNRTASLGSISSTVRSSISYSSFRRKTSDNQPPPTPPPPPSLPQVYAPKVVEMMLKIRYTGGAGMEADYCRQSSVAINVEVSPSVLITKWDVLPAERPTHCYLVLDILNTTEHEMEVQYTSNKRILIEARETCRIPVPVERCPLTKLVSLSPEDVATQCRQHVASLVDLRWSVPTLETSGSASISNLVWTPLMLDLIRMSPIQWEICLNENPFKPECDFSFGVGEVINLSITIGNYSELSLVDLCLKVDCYQDHQNGHYNYRVENKIGFIGCDCIIVSEIDKQAVFCHQCGIIFFCTGVYKLDIQCSNLGATTLQRRINPTPDREASKSEGHTWKCLPAIEITITEK